MGHLTTRVLAVFTTLLMAIGLAAALSTSASATTTTTTAATTVKNVAPAANLAARRRVNYGAITVNFKDGTAGFGNDKASKRKAIKVSKRKCRRAAGTDHKRHCKPAVWVRNGCAAVAVRLNKAKTAVVKSRVAIKFTKKKAIRKAKKKVGRGAKTYAYLCTTRYR